VVSITKISNPADELVPAMLKEGVLWFTPACTGNSFDHRVLPLDNPPQVRCKRIGDHIDGRPGDLTDPSHVVCGVHPDFFRAVAQGAVVPVLEVDASPGSATWAYGFLGRAIEACGVPEDDETGLCSTVRFPVPTHCVANPRRHSGSPPLTVVSWAEAFAPSQSELYGAQGVYWHLVHTVLSALEPCLCGHASRDEQILLQSVAVFLLVTPFNPLLRWLPRPYSPANLDNLPDWGVVTGKVAALGQRLAESRGRPFAELVDADFALEVHTAGSLWEAIPEVFFKHLPPAREAFEEEIGMLSAGLRQELLAALDLIGAQRPDFAITAVRQFHASRRAEAEASASAFPASMVELEAALAGSTNYWGMVYKDCYLRRMPSIAELQELNRSSNASFFSLPPRARYELVYRGKTPGASYGLLQTNEGDTTAFVTYLGQGLIAVIPKGTTESRLARMLPELAVGELYVPAWDLLRRRLAEGRHEHTAPAVPSPEHSPPVPQLFRAPAGTRWEDLELRWNDDSSLIVRLVNPPEGSHLTSKVLTFSELGLRKGQTTDPSPSKAWGMLCDILRDEGEYRGRPDTDEHKAAKHTLGEVRDAINRIVGGSIAGDPIPFDRKAKTYKARFRTPRA
jgi:hypothetical protein